MIRLFLQEFVRRTECGAASEYEMRMADCGLRNGLREKSWADFGNLYDKCGGNFFERCGKWERREG